MRNPSTWLDVDAPLEARQFRFFFIQNTTIHLLQVGAHDDDLGDDQTSLSFNCYKKTEVNRLIIREVGDSNHDENPKRTRIEHTRQTLKSSLPSSFLSNTAKETRMLRHCRDYQAAFGQLHPMRRPLFLTPENEAGIPKCVSTTIRPTEMVYAELYEYQAAATFIANFIKYEPLENPVMFPTCLPSPMSVLSWQAGDCFDLSVALASVLSGAGYNAYVVVGYAPRHVTLNDQSGRMCPLLAKELGLDREVSRDDSQSMAVMLKRAREEALRAKEALAREKEARLEHGEDEDGVALGAEANDKYLVREQPELVSQYHAMLDAERDAAAAAQRAAEEAVEKAEEAERLREEAEEAALAGEDDEDGPGPDPHLGRRVHAWVLLLPKKRDVIEPLFIEPSTGVVMTPAKSEYLGVEMIFNHQNAWVCMQMPEPHSDARATPQSLTWDLTDPLAWEFVLSPAPDIMADPDMYDAHADLSIAALAAQREMDAAAKAQREGQKRGGSGSGPRNPNSLGIDMLGLGGDDDSENGSLGSSRHAAQWVSRLAGTAVQDSTGAVIEMPPTWVPRLTIPRDAFDTRCPRGHKTIHYDKCRMELFAYFGECAKAYEGRDRCGGRNNPNPNPGHSIPLTLSPSRTLSNPL